MYLEHWKLAHSPFAPRFAARSFHASPTHEEALARLQFLVEDGRRVGLMLGPSGCGKSVVLDVLRRELTRFGTTVVTLSLLGVDEDEALWQLAAGCGLNPATNATRASLWRGLLDYLIAQRRQQLATAFLFDDAHEATADVLTVISRFLDWEQTPDSRFTVVLSAVPEFAARLGQRILQLAELRVNLEPWDQQDTADYARAMVAAARGDRPLFSESALERLHRLSGGVPRRAAQLADLALVAGAGQELDQVTAEVVQSAYEELSMGEVMVLK